MSEPNRVASRIQSAIETCRAWDADSTLLVECRAQIPFHLLCPEQYYIDTHNRSKGNDVTIDDKKKKERSITKSPFAKNDDDKYEGDDLLLKRLTLFFQDLMTWVNNPPCSHCGCTTTESRGSRGAETKEEREGKASRVECKYVESVYFRCVSYRWFNPRVTMKISYKPTITQIFISKCIIAQLATVQPHFLDTTRHVNYWKLKRVDVVNMQIYLAYFVGLLDLTLGMFNANLKN